MEEKDPVVSFLQTTQQLLQATAATNNTGDWHPDAWIKRYEEIVEQLTPGFEAYGEIRRCWKLSQDILIRLRRLLSDPKGNVSDEKQGRQKGRDVFAEQDSEDVATRLLGRKAPVSTEKQDTQQGHVVFTERDIEVLARRLLDMQQRVEVATQGKPADE